MTTEYLDRFDVEHRLRVQIQTERGQVIDFVVQLESFIHNRWQVIVRYNCAHGTPHKDTLHPDGAQDKEWFYHETPSEVLNRAIEDIKRNYHRYKENYESEKNKYQKKHTRRKKP